jgi:hypothetical protein
MRGRQKFFILIYRKTESRKSALIWQMALFIFRCPKTSLNVQGFTADDPTSTGDDVTYEMVTCTACTRTHFVSPKTGKVMGADGELCLRQKAAGNRSV